MIQESLTVMDKEDIGGEDGPEVLVKNNEEIVLNLAES